MATKNVEIKAKDDGTVTLAGYGVIWDSQDLEGEQFTRDTDFMMDTFPTKLCLYDHGFDPMIGQEILGLITNDDIKLDDTGMWVEVQLERHNRYVEMVLELLEQDPKALGWSSGSIGRLTKREGGTIKKWPLVDISLTPTPAEYRTKGVAEIRALAKRVDGLEEALSQALGADDDSEAIIEESKIMTDETVTVVEESPPEQDDAQGLASKVDALSDSVTKILGMLQDAPAVKRSGYLTEVGGSADPDVKNFADFLAAISRNDAKRLATVYKSTKDMGSTVGGAGGYLVPEEFNTRLLEIMQNDNPIVSRVFRQPVVTASGRYPTLDIFAAPTAGAGDTAFSSNLTPATVGEGGQYGEDEPTFELLEYTIHKIGELVDVPQELLDDAGVAIEALLTRLFAIAISAKVERHILRGTGAGQPLGILNSGAIVNITPASDNAFGEADALTMFSRFHPMPAGSPVWIMHRSVIPDFVNFTSSNTDMVEWRQQVPGSLLGYPIIYSEHSPQANNAGNVILADLSAYILFDRRQLTIAFSDDFRFDRDLVTWKYNVRLDGMPWMKSAITLADPQGSFTVSPFVVHND